MTNRNNPASKTSKIIYWIATIWLALGMVSTAIVQLLKTKTGQGALDSITHLGYPVYLLTILGVWKILGVLTILLPGGRQAFLNLLKEWAYAGFFFVMSGAIFSHIALADTIAAIFPALLLLMLTLVSWYFRPLDRKIILIVVGKVNQ